MFLIHDNRAFIASDAILKFQTCNIFSAKKKKFSKLSKVKIDVSMHQPSNPSKAGLKTTICLAILFAEK
jgi:hypothetical protein